MFIPRPMMAVSKCAAKESTRYAINAVQVERDGDDCRAIVTDGRCVLVGKWQEKEFKPVRVLADKATSRVDDFHVMIRADHWDSVRKQTKETRRDDDGVMLTEKVIDPESETETVEFTHLHKQDGTRSPDTPHEPGRFPAWRDVIPSYTIGRDAIEIGIDPQLLGNLLLAMNKMNTDESSRGVRLVVPMDSSRPLLLESTPSSKRTQTRGVLMPLHLERYHCPKCHELKGGSDYNPYRRCDGVDRCDQCRMGENGDDKRKKLAAKESENSA